MTRPTESSERRPAPHRLPRAGVPVVACGSGDATIARVASRQHGVVSRDQLVASGFTPSSIGHGVRRGRLHRLHRGVYAVGHDAVGVSGRVLGAVLAVGPGAVASHRSAALMQGILPPGAPATDGLVPVDVSLVGGRQLRDRRGVRAHVVRTWDDRDLRWVGPVPVTSAARTVLDIAAGGDRRATERVLAQALRRRLTSETEVRALLERSFGHHGVGIVASLIDAGPAFDRSVAERTLLELLRRSGLPEPRANGRAAGYEVDLLWEDLAVVVEFDGFTFHGDVLAFRADRRKSARLQAEGYDVVPVVWADLQGAPELVVATIATVLALARARREVWRSA